MSQPPEQHRSDQPAPQQPPTGQAEQTPQQYGQPDPGQPYQGQPQQGQPQPGQGAAAPSGYSDAGPASYPLSTAPVAAAKPVKQRGGFGRGFGAGLGWALGAGLVAIVLGAVTTGIFTMGMVALGSTQSSEATAMETLWGEPTATNSIRAIPITGVILGDSTGQPPLFGAGTYGYDVAAQLDDLDEADADAVVLELNTPGGTVFGSRAISDAVDRYKERTGNPVVAYVRGTSASGGMYAMAGVDRIIVDHGTMVGSIGVIMGPFERYTDVTATDGGLLGTGVTAGGIESYYITRGTGKDLGNPYRDMTPEERASLDNWMDAEYQAFVNHVATKRDIPAETIQNTYGAFMFGPQGAIENNLADLELGQDEAYRNIAELADIDPDSTKVEMESSQYGFLSMLLGARSGAQPGSAQPENMPTELAQGQAAVRASAICVGSPAVLAMSGELAQYCG